MPTRKEPASEEFACTPFSSQHATFNHVWSSLLLEELFRLGVRDIALAPGSRSWRRPPIRAFAVTCTLMSEVSALWRSGWPREATGRWR